MGVSDKGNMQIYLGYDICNLHKKQFFYNALTKQFLTATS